MAAGLQTHIWNNNLRCIVLLALYPVLIGFIVWLCAYSIGQVQNYPAPGEFAGNFIWQFWPMILTVVVIWFTAAFFLHTRMIRKLAKSHPVSRKDEPELYNLLENLCIAEGMPMPRLEIIETHARNAFASGIDEKSYAITVTRGLMNSLQKDELEAVLGHELTHIKNRDVRLLIVTIIFTGMIGFAAQMVWNSIRYNMHFVRGNNNRGKGSGALVIIMIAGILWLGYIATLVMRFALSRKREFMADAGAIEMTKNPDAMMRALMRIAGRAQIPETTDDIAMMCIENKHALFGLFATHPPIEKRIQAISQYTGTSVPEIMSLGPAMKDQRLEGAESRKNPWLVRERKFRNPL